jgi:4-diphosphocytidyl-2-C-methyl-D-erythritol kinase
VMRGIGEKLSPPLALPHLPAVLINPRVAVPTRDVFAKFAGTRAGSALPEPVPVAAESFIAFLERHGNDLTSGAIACAPVVAEVLDGLRALPNTLLARMSGSGATCFGLFASAGEAAAAASLLQSKHKDWFVYQTTLG